jgi:hypothetical protein
VIGRTNLGSGTHALLPVSHHYRALFALARVPIILGTGALSQRSFNKGGPLQARGLKPL